MNDPIAELWMQTYSGKRYYPLSPNPQDIDMEDIAHSLSLLCRFGGHVDRFYSVAEHCVVLSKWVAPENALAALLHDATEAYVVDLPRPVKHVLPQYKELEAVVWDAIARKYNIDPILPEDVKEGDNRILINEHKTLMSRSETWTVDALEPLPVEITGWPPQDAEYMYIQRFQELI